MKGNVFVRSNNVHETLYHAVFFFSSSSFSSDSLSLSLSLSLSVCLLFYLLSFFFFSSSSSFSSSFSFVFQGAQVQFEGGWIGNVAYKGHYPVLVQGGGVSFDNTTVVDTGHTRNWLEAGWRTTVPVCDVTGSVNVYTTSGQCTTSFNTTRGDTNDTLAVHCHQLQAAGAPATYPTQTVAHCPQCPSYVILDAENFTASGWMPQPWAHSRHLFASGLDFAGSKYENVKQ